MNAKEVYTMYLPLEIVVEKRGFYVLVLFSVYIPYKKMTILFMIYEKQQT